MAASYGRAVEFTWGGAPIEGIREKTLTVGGQAVDVSSDEDDGYRVLLDEDATKQIDYALSGVVKDQILRAAKLTGNIVDDVVITYLNGDTLSFTANLAEYSEGQPYQDAVTISATLMSTGPWTYVPAAP